MREVPNRPRTARPDVRYRYEIGERVYQGTRLVPPPVELAIPWPQADYFIKQFPVGGTIPVSYSPADPQDAVLLPGLSSGHLWGLGAMVAWVLAPLVLVGWYWVRRLRRRKSESSHQS